MPTYITELESRRKWMTDVYECKIFSSFIKGEIKNDLMKRIIVNGMADSSWLSKGLKGSRLLSPISRKNLLSLKIEYIDFEASVSNEDANLNFSSDGEKDNDNRSFIDDSSEVGDEEPSFYRIFFNQTKDPAEAVLDDGGLHLDTRDLLPEMFSIEERNNVEFDEFEGNGKCLEQLKKSLLSFQGDLKDSFFDAVLYGLLFKLSENSRIISRNDIEKILGIRFYKELSECRELLLLDDSLNGFFKKCTPVNKFLEKKIYS